MSVGAGAVGGGAGGDEYGIGVLSTSTSTYGTGSSLLGGSFATSSAASSCCWRIIESGMYRERSIDKTWGQLIPAQCVAPQGTSDALGPDSATSTSIKEKP